MVDIGVFSPLKRGTYAILWSCRHRPPPLFYLWQPFSVMSICCATHDSHFVLCHTPTAAILCYAMPHDTCGTFPEFQMYLLVQNVGNRWGRPRRSKTSRPIEIQSGIMTLLRCALKCFIYGRGWDNLISYNSDHSLMIILVASLVLVVWNSSFSYTDPMCLVQWTDISVTWIPLLCHFPSSSSKVVVKPEPITAKDTILYPYCLNDMSVNGVAINNCNFLSFWSLSEHGKPFTYYVKLKGLLLLIELGH